MEDADKLLGAISKSDPNFMYSEIQELIGDRLFNEPNKDYQQALEHYQQSISHDQGNGAYYVKAG